MSKIDLWTLVDYLPTQMPLDKQKLERALSVVLLPAADSNEYFEFFKGGPAHLAGGVQIEWVDLRLSREIKTKTLLVLTLSGQCVGRAAVLARDTELRITQTPRGRSPQEQTMFGRSTPWGKLSFGFSEANPECLRTAVLETS